MDTRQQGQDDQLWSALSSDFFRSMSGQEDLNETPPSAKTISSLFDARLILHMIFMVDVSGSMRGQRIAMVNNAMEAIIRELKHRDDMNAVIKLSILTFSEEASWLTPQPVPLEDFILMKLSAQPWITNFAPAFDELGRVLRREGFLNPDLGEYYAPLILFVTDGEPTDTDAYPDALARLKQNGWFRKSTKYAIATGAEARTEQTRELLCAFTGSRENVRYADEGEALCDLIQFIAVRASEVQTSVMSTGGAAQQIPSVFSGEDGFFSSLFDA